MDLFDYALTWGNVGVLDYYHSALGWVYIAIKTLFYLLLVSGAVWYLFNKFKYKYQVDIEVVGSNGTITEFIDSAKYVQQGTKVRLKRRRLTIPAPDKRYITAVMGKMFVKGKIRLYQFGETEYSYTPIETKLNSDNEIKFNPIDPKLSALESLNKSSMQKFNDKKSMIMQYAPLMIGLGFVAACFIMLIFALEQIKPLLANISDLVLQTTKLLGQAQATTVVPPVGGGIVY